MVDWIWFLLLAIGVVYGIATGNVNAVTEAAFAAANNAVVLILEICGLMCLWLGLLKIAEASGLVAKLGKLLSPLIRRLFPDVPASHPAFSFIMMNAAANLLGLGNAATPFGIKAMEQLQTLNPRKDTATPAMITLLVMNTSCITLLPTMVISLRVSANSADPTAIIGATVLASSIGLLCALLLDSLMRKKQGGA